MNFLRDSKCCLTNETTSHFRCTLLYLHCLTQSINCLVHSFWIGATSYEFCFWFQIDENVQREIINHRSLRHPNIIRFKEVTLENTNSFIRALPHIYFYLCHWDVICILVQIWQPDLSLEFELFLADNTPLVIFVNVYMIVLCLHHGVQMS